MSKRALEPNLDEDEELFKGASPAAAKKLKKENDRAKEKGKEKGKETKKVVSMRSFLQERDAEDGETLESFLDSLTRVRPSPLTLHNLPVVNTIDYNSFCGVCSLWI